MFDKLAVYFLIVLIYSFLGYLIEVLFCSYLQKKLVNRGFLFGPLCPIYGIGSLILYLLLSRFSNNYLIVFLLGMIITSILEYFTSYIFELIFHNKWWDYSDHKFNINGRVSLGNSLFFGTGAVIVIFSFEKIEYYLNTFIPSQVLNIVAIILFILTIIDFVISCVIAYNLRTRLIVAEELKHEKIKMIPSLLERKYKNQIKRIKFKADRLIKSYPTFAKNLRKELNIVKKMSMSVNKKSITKKKSK